MSSDWPMPKLCKGRGATCCARLALRRGSTIILVLAILSILILIAATLSYTARLEELSSRNFADGVQSRMAAQTGVGQFFALADGRTTSVAPLWPASMAFPLSGSPGIGPSSLRSPALPVGTQVVGAPALVAPAAAGSRFDPKRAAMISPESEFARLGDQSSLATELAQMRIVDESAKININALGSWAEFGTGNISATASTSRATSSVAAAVRPVALADALYAILSSREVNYPGASREMAQRLARAILRYRYGPDGQPGRAGVDDDNDGPGQSILRAQGTLLPIAALAAGQSSSQLGSARSAAGAARNVPSFETGTISLAGVRASDYSAGVGRDGLDNDLDGAVDESGEGIDEPDECVADPRLPPNGDDRPFRQIEDLLLVEGMTPEIFQALRPYVTVFSASERRTGPERNASPQMDLNAATPEELYERLRAAFPGVPVETIAQFVANVVDCRDADSVPTVVRLEGRTDPILGVEVTPCITEVWPNVVTDPRDSDSGKFIEIFNPYDTAVSLAGWSLRIGGQTDNLRNPAGARVDLRGSLVAGGFLIVTDNYNRIDNAKADEFPGYGSFYKVFGVVPNSRNRLMIELPTLGIPGSAGMIELRDAQGHLVDFFQYGGGAAGGLRRSYQRQDPRIRVSHVARCTPYSLAPTSGGDSATVFRNLISAANIRNAPFQNALELFSIGSTFTGGLSQQATAWQTPAISRGRPDTLDERLADLFTVWTDRDPQWVRSRLAAADAASSFALSAISLETTGPSALCECGKINLNSASLPVLRVLPGLADRQIGYLLMRRQSSPAADITGKPMAYARLSELLADDGFWAGAAPSARLSQLAGWLGSITFTSRAYSIVSENLADPSSGPRLASRSKVEALVSTDGGKNQVVFWRYLE